MDYSFKNFDKDKEFENIVKYYFMPLLGMVSDDVQSVDKIKNTSENENKTIFIERTDTETSVYFRIVPSSNIGYKIIVSKEFKQEYLKLITSVYNDIKDITYFNLTTGEKRRKPSYSNFSKLVHAYDKSVHDTIVRTFFIDFLSKDEKKNDEMNNRVYQLLDLLEDWSSKTYEGKKVPFAIVINDKSSESDIDFLKFLNEEYSATFSDGVNSIIELDKNLMFYDYKSITKDDCFKSITINSASPYRFAQVMNEFTENKIAVFLLSTGDIVLVNNAKIKLVKREGKWHNFDSDVFIGVLKSTISNDDSNTIANDVLNAIYATSLDVSFAHSGGIIAVTKDASDLIKDNKLEKLKSDYESIKTDWISDKISNPMSFTKYFNNKISNFSIIDYIDYLPFGNLDYLYDTYSEYYKNDKSNYEKRMIKRKMLQNLIKNKPFYRLDRKLRTELVSMDGATIIDYKGNIISVGAIIQNDSGSYGGGRGAAAKKLSNFGIAIKISTDGYIEVYKKEKIIYKIK